MYLSISFCSHLLSCILQMIFSFQEPYLWPCFYSSCSHSSLTRVLSALKCGGDRICSSFTQLNSIVFCWLVVPVKWKKKFQTHWLTELLFTFLFSNASRVLFTICVSTLWPSYIAQILQPIVCVALKKSKEIEWVNTWTSLHFTFFLVPLLHILDMYPGKYTVVRMKMIHSKHFWQDCSEIMWMFLNDIYRWSQETSVLFTSCVLLTLLSSLVLALIPLTACNHLSILALFLLQGCCTATSRDRRQTQRERWKTYVSGCILRQIYMCGQHPLVTITVVLCFFFLW